MPIRTITLPSGKVCTMKITNLHPDGTEFDPSEIIIGKTPGTERAAEILGRIIKHAAEKKAKEKASRKPENQV